MNVLFHVSEVKRFTAPQTLEINNLIADWSPQAVDILKNYWPGGEDLIPVDASHYDLLGNWASLAFYSTQYLLFNVRDAIAMIESFKLFQNSADLLSPLRNKMAIGKVSKQVCTEAGGTAIDCQDHLMAAIRQYFKHNLE